MRLPVCSDFEQAGQGLGPYLQDSSADCKCRWRADEPACYLSLWLLSITFSHTLTTARNQILLRQGHSTLAARRFNCSRRSYRAALSTSAASIRLTSARVSSSRGSMNARTSDVQACRQSGAHSLNDGSRLCKVTVVMQLSRHDAASAERWLTSMPSSSSSSSFCCTVCSDSHAQQSVVVKAGVLPSSP